MIFGLSNYQLLLFYFSNHLEFSHLFFFDISFVLYKLLKINRVNTIINILIIIIKLYLNLL